MAGSYYVPLPAYNPGPGINFEPVNQALEGILQQNNANRQYGLQQRASDRADQQLAITKQSADAAAHDAMIRQSAGIAQAALNERDPAKKAAMMTQIYGLHPEYKDRLTAAGIDPNNYDGTASFIVNEARGYLDPQAVQLRNLQMDEARSNIAKTNMEVAAGRRQAEMFNSLFSEFGIQPSTGSPAIMPAASSGYSGQGQNALVAGSPSGGTTNALMTSPSSAPQRNALVPPPATSPVSGPVNNALLPGLSTQASRAFSVPSSKATQPAPGNVPSPSTSLPAPGDPTSFTGDSASGMTTPTRISADTKRAMALDLVLNGGKGMASILNNDPGSKYATKYAEQTASDNAALNLKQKMTAPMLDIIQGMREKLDAAGPEIADMATGPNYGQLSDDPSWIESGAKSVLPDTSAEFYQNARAAVRNIANSTLGYIPGVGQFTQPLADRGNAARNLNLELHHLVKGIGAGVKAIPGTKGGGVSTDADQALVLDAVGEAMHSADAATRNNILFDAENILRARAGMPRLPAPPSYQPSSLALRHGAPSDGASASTSNGATATALAGARDAISKGADPAAVRQRLIQNGINPDGL